MQTPQKKKAFTLIELIIVIAIIGILAAAIFVAVDPARRLHEARNARRSTDVATIMEAIKKHQVDNEGTILAAITAEAQDVHLMIATNGADAACESATLACPGDINCFDMSTIDTSSTNYLPVQPIDPGASSTVAAYSSQYYVEYDDESGALKVGACDEEGEDAGGGGTAPTIELIR